MVAYQVGDLVVDVARAQVSRAGVPVPLPRLSFDLFVALVRAAPRVVSIDELMDRVWAGVVVSPETVSQRAKLLRDALGDDSKSPRYVAAVRSRGYRLVAEVSIVPQATAMQPAAAASQPEMREPVPAPVDTQVHATTPTAGRRRLALLVAMLTAVFFIAGFLAVTRYRAQEEVAPRSAAGSRTHVAARSIAVLPFESAGDEPDGDVLAFGIAEAVLHQLANLHGLEVIARTSSFSLRDPPGDAREIGRQLGVRYLLEGSVQQEGARMRVTAQLIDAQSGAHVWSIRFDRPRTGIFAVQDEIAAQVASALQLSLDPAAARRLAGQGTVNFEAYLNYMQGRALLATGRIADVTIAIERFKEAVRLDPAFAGGYVSLAEAEVFVAEFDARADRSQLFAAAVARASDHLDRALELDPQAGPAYLMRGYLRAFSDLAGAEADYRRGLELKPSDAQGHAGLAAVLFERPAKRAEALVLLEQARRLDPLEPAHDVTKSVLLLYDRGDVTGAEALLRNVLERRPDYLPALTRLGELLWCCAARPAEAAQLLERALTLDPQAHWPRRPLLRAYLDMDEQRAAEAVARGAAHAVDVLQVPLLAHRGAWQRAGELAYAAIADGLVTPLDETIAVLAIRRYARLTGDHARAIRVLEELSGVAWAADGSPLLPERPGLRPAEIGLGDMLQLSGDADRGRQLLEAILRRMQAELRQPPRSEFWYYGGRAVAHALLGQHEQALVALQQGTAASGLLHGGWDLEADPAFDRLQGDQRFQAVLAQAREHAAAQRQQLEQLRLQGLVPTHAP